MSRVFRVFPFPIAPSRVPYVIPSRDSTSVRQQRNSNTVKGESSCYTIILPTRSPIIAPDLLRRIPIISVRVNHRCLAAAASAACLVSTKSWMVAILTPSSDELNVKMKMDSLANEAPPGASPSSFD